MFHFYMQHREEFLGHYHKRSNVATTFQLGHSLLGFSISRRRVNQLQFRRHFLTLFQPNNAYQRWQEIVLTREPAQR
jgi:hypothetical protein